ncbi:hypothetical protein ACTA71_012597 [Dictyostelium dimigraforme]
MSQFNNNLIFNFYNYKPFGNSIDQKIKNCDEETSENETDDENSSPRDNKINNNQIESDLKIKNGNMHKNDKFKSNSNFKRTLSLSLEENRKKIKNQLYKNDFMEGSGNYDSWNGNLIPTICSECNNSNQQTFNSYKSKDSPFLSFIEPLTFIHEANKVIHIELEIPGVDKDDVNVDLSNNILSILAKKKSIYPSFQNMSEFKRHEKSSGVYKRVLEFNPNTVDKETIKARNVNGTLLITVNKY